MDDGRVVPARHRLDVEEYYRMADAGIFGEDDRIELIDGELIDMAPIGQGHAAVVTGLAEVLVLACNRRAIVSPQNPVRLDRWSEPRPDLAVLRRRADFYATGDRPGPADVLLIVEVADSSLAFDRGVKLPLYARAGVAELWIVDLKRRVVDAYREPAGEGYRETATYRPGEQVALALAPEIVVTLDLVFG
jgi:Uma2 family endonuclease